jgi:thymidylate synthase
MSQLKIPLVNIQWLELLQKILNEGNDIVCRNYITKEILFVRTPVMMSHPLITLKRRALGYRFACAEAAWVLSGDNRVSTIKEYSNMIDKFSDDKVTFFGAYGPKIVDQLEYITRTLVKDIYSRRAVLNIWREKPPLSLDIPCTLNIQFLVRKEQDGSHYLHLVDNMRSSDAWLGVPYDWFTFSMLACYFCLYIKKSAGIELNPGVLAFNVASQHLYNKSFGYDLSRVKDVIAGGVEDELFRYLPINIGEFNDPDEFIEHLWSLARHKRGLKGKTWLSELTRYWEEK